MASPAITTTSSRPYCSSMVRVLLIDKDLLQLLYTYIITFLSFCLFLWCEFPYSFLSLLDAVSIYSLFHHQLSTYTYSIFALACKPPNQHIFIIWLQYKIALQAQGDIYYYTQFFCVFFGPIQSIIHFLKKNLHTYTIEHP